MNKTKLKIGDEVAYKEGRGSFPCKAKVLKVMPGGIYLHANFSYTVYNPEPNDEWEVVRTTGKCLIGYWWNYEHGHRRTRREAEVRKRLVLEGMVLKKEIEKRLNELEIDYFVTPGGFSFGNKDIAKLLGIRLFAVDEELGQ